MSKLTYTVEPQRPAPRGGFVGCLPAQATRFAVVRKQWFKRGARSYNSTSVVFHCIQRADAEADCARRTRASEPLLKRVLGGRFGAFRGEPIAQGLGAKWFSESLTKDTSHD